MTDVVPIEANKEIAALGPPKKYRKSLLPYRRNQIVKWLEWLEQYDIYVYTHLPTGDDVDINNADQLMQFVRARFEENELKRYRLMSGLTQTQAAQLMDIPVKTWGNWEQDRRRTPVATLKAFGRYVAKRLKPGLYDD